MPNDEDKGKSIDNPYPFRSWEELIALANNTQGIHYLYFDSRDRLQINWDNITIDYQIEGTAILYIDWRGNYIRNLNINLPYNDETKDKKQLDTMAEMAFVFKDYEVGAYQHWRNLEVENMYISDPRVALFRRWTVIHSCWFHNVVVSSKLGATSEYWTIQHGDNLCPFGLACSITKSIINFHSQNIATRIPAVTLYDTLLTVDYKWTMSGASTNDNGLFVRAYPRQGTTGFKAWNSIVEGTIDLSQSTGNIDDFYLLCNDITGWDEHNSAGGIPGILANNDAQSVTLNLKIKNSAHCSVKLKRYSFGNTYKTYDNPPRYKVATTYGSPAECVVVYNNGDGFDEESIFVYVTSDKIMAERYSNYELMSPDYLDDQEYNYIADDGTRFDVLYNEFTSAYPSRADFFIYPASDPDWVKRKNPVVNNQYPFLPFEIYPVRQMPVNNGAVSKSEDIIIYDMQTAQNNFDNNGLAVLTPSSCRIVEELNGAYNLTMTHPADEDEKYKYILEMNIIKALGQLFVINRVEEVTTGNSHYVTCYAEHITYTLNDRWIFPPFTVAGYHGQTLIDSIMAQSFYFDDGWQTQYAFTVTSDLDAEDTYDDWKDVEEGATPYEMFIGTNGLVSRLGGELYRDNFNMSINKRMQNAQDGAFEIKVGYNCTGIKRTVDLTTFATYLKAFPFVNGELYGDGEYWFAVAWDPSTLPRAFPREIIRSINIHYKKEEEIDKLGRDCMAYFAQVCEPLVSYEFNMKDLRRNPEYKDFENNYRFKVGDTGRIWDERLQAWTDVQISRTEKDGITGDTVKVIIGNTRSFTRPNSYNPLVPNDYHIDADTVLEGVPPLTFDANGAYLSDWSIAGAGAGVGDLVNKLDISAWDTTVLSHTISLSGNPYTGFVGGTMTATADGFTVTIDGSMSNMSYTLSAEYPQSGYSTPIRVPRDTACELSWTQSESRQATYVMVYAGGTQTRLALTSSSDDRSLSFTSPSDNDYIDILFLFGGPIQSTITFSNLKLTAGEYEIPVTISQGQTSQTIHIPIPSPLGDTQGVSKESSGIDIPTYVGANLLTVDTTVQPSNVKIQYRKPIEQENQGN